MISITICDDDPAVISTFQEYAERYNRSSSAQLDWIFLSDPSALDPNTLAAEDILILDIQMGEVNGIGG